MRDLILVMTMSLDGFVSDIDGGIAWMFNGDQAARAWRLAVVSEAGLHIMGSRTFRDMAAHWPASTDIFAPAMNQIPKAVFSAQGEAILPPATDASQPASAGWAEAYVARGDLATEIAKLKTAPGKPVVAHGGATFARSLLASGLVDQLNLVICPVALGQGRPIFTGLAEQKRFTLVSSQAFPRGAIAQIYRPA